MDFNYDKKFFENYIKKLNANQINQMYNLKNQQNMKSHLLQFKQIIAFYNFKKKLNEDLSRDISMQNSQNEPNFVNNKMYLIDKDWIQKWKKHVGYEEMKETSQKFHLNRELNDDDYNWIEPIINKNSSENLLSPLENRKFFDDDENLLADFIIVDEYCYKLFTIGERNTINELMNKSYTIKIYKEKLILNISNKVHLLIFKEKQSQTFFELLIIFRENHSNITKVLNDIERKDINEWIKKINLVLISDINKNIDISIYGFKIDIINKNLYFIRNKNLRNTIFPSFTRGEELLKVKGESIPKDLKEKIKTQVINNLKQKNNNCTNNIPKISNSEKIIKSTNENEKTGKTLQRMPFGKNNEYNDIQEDNKPITSLKKHNKNKNFDEKIEKYINSKIHNNFTQQNNLGQNNYGFVDNQINSKKNNLMPNNNDYNMNNNNNIQINTGIILQNNSNNFNCNLNNKNNIDDNNQNNQNQFNYYNYNNQNSFPLNDGTNKVQFNQNNNSQNPTNISSNKLDNNSMNNSQFSNLNVETNKINQFNNNYDNANNNNQNPMNNSNNQRVINSMNNNQNNQKFLNDINGNTFFNLQKHFYSNNNNNKENNQNTSFLF